MIKIIDLKIRSYNVYREILAVFRRRFLAMIESKKDLSYMRDEKIFSSCHDCSLMNTNDHVNDNRVDHFSRQMVDH